MDRDEGILIVEDDMVLVAEPLKKQLVALGFTVLGIAKNEADAIELAKRERPAVVIMDIRLHEEESDIAGIRAAKQIQQEVGSGIVFLTQLGVDERLADEMRQVRDYGFLKKPATDDQLQSTVRLALLRRRGKKVVFVCYSHSDAAMVTELNKFLMPLSDIGIDGWVDRKIEVGRRWRDEISRALDQASAAIMLISIDFVNSRFIRDFELPALLKDARDRGVYIYPVFVRYVPGTVLRRCGLDEFEGVNPPDDPVLGWEQTRRERYCWARLCETVEADLA